MAIVDYHRLFGWLNDLFDILCGSDELNSTKPSWLGRGGDYGACIGVFADDGCRHGDDGDA